EGTEGVLLRGAVASASGARSTFAVDQVAAHPLRATIKATATAVVRIPAALPDKGRRQVPAFSRNAPCIREEIFRLVA
ncbi:MAG: hypothetical protein ACE5FR_14315, partial [Rhodospirillales bacterium]